MTPEEFKNLKRGDKVSVIDIHPIRKRQNDNSSILEVAGIHIEYECILCFTPTGWGEPIEGWVAFFELPESDLDRWGCRFYIDDVDVVQTVLKQERRGSGANCVLCGNHNPWGDPNYPKDDPKVHACWSCRDSRPLQLRHFMRNND